ncbi:MAG: chemotaxis-specific protein-glutamate methyltransferase CheB [Betaproteobacteria bacterium]|nr:MAG: chemotaxis-specific protein-glutamate methyltransferase CheB [Betaproteobacteria bacterium]
MSAADARKKVRVLVVEDSPVMRELLAHLLGTDPGIEVVGFASDGEEALAAVREKKPDVVTMDFHMPRVNGLDATRRIMETHPTPIVIVSGSSARTEVASAFHLLEAGALAVVEKPRGPGHPDHEAAARELVQTVKTMAEVKVVRRWARREAPLSPAPAPRSIRIEAAAARTRLVAIGASTGGPIVLRAILAGLPGNFSVPILIVQHIAPGFTDGFVEWLGQASGFAVHVAADAVHPLPGHAYVAPDGLHIKLRHDGAITLSRDAPQNGHRPSVSCLFRSVAAVLGRNAIGVLLTGMGKDGAEELKLMRDRGAVTIAQDRDTSVVHGMPGEAVSLDAASYVLSPPEIAAALGGLAG